MSVGALCSQEISWGCMGGVVEGIWEYLSGNVGMGGAGMCFGDTWVLSPYSMEP